MRHLKNATISHREIKCKMSIFNLFLRKDINEGVVQYRKEDNAVLLDVRTDEEFSEGHHRDEQWRNHCLRNAE